MEGPLALFTDFGADSIYIGQMHAAAASVQPGIQVIDLFHDTAAFDIFCSAVLLAALLDQTPRGTALVWTNAGSSARITVFSARPSPGLKG